MLKILFIPNKKYESDFQRDTIFYGLRYLQNNNKIIYETTAYNKYLYIENQEYPNHHYTYQHKWTESIPPKPDIKNIWEKIENKYYDIIIYNVYSIIDDSILTKLYKFYKNNLFIVNGEDGGGSEYLKQISKYRYIKYFKREINDGKYGKYPYLFPINFGFPDELITKNDTIKIRDISSIIPGDIKSYIYNEQEYYEEYRRSKFAFTYSKAGWDCLRHLEIIFNHCIPIFLDIDHCPACSLYFYPKFQLSQILLNNLDFKLDKLHYEFIYQNGKNKFWIDTIKSKIIKIKPILDNQYHDIQQEIYNHSLKYLTCSQIVNYILKYYD